MESFSPREWFERTEFMPDVCCTCGRSGQEVRLERGHVLMAKCKGGQEWFVQCVECNVRQGDLSLDEWSDGGDKGRRNDTDVRELADTYAEVQKMRMRLANRIDAKQKRSDTGDASILEEVLQDIQADEAKLKREIGRFTRRLREGDRFADMLMGVPGIGPLLTARLLAEIDWSRVHSLDGLYLFFGVAPGCDRLVKGKVRRFSRRAKISLRVWADGIKRGRGHVGSYAAYGGYYDKIKAASLDDTRHADWSPGHHDNHALRMTAKLFLKHLFVVWAAVQSGVNGNHEPQDYGWPEV